MDDYTPVKITEKPVSISETHRLPTRLIYSALSFLDLMMVIKVNKLKKMMHKDKINPVINKICGSPSTVSSVDVMFG